MPSTETFGKPTPVFLACFELGSVLVLGFTVFYYAMIPAFEQVLILYPNRAADIPAWNVAINLIGSVLIYVCFLIWLSVLIVCFWKGQKWAWHNGVAFFLSMHITVFFGPGMIWQKLLSILISLALFLPAFLHFATRAHCGISGEVKESALFRVTVLFLFFSLLLASWVYWVESIALAASRLNLSP